jgi:putative ABC transport system permease protein
VDLRAHRGHTLISIVSMVVGVVAVVLTSVAGLVAREVFIAQEEQRTARAVTHFAEVTIAHPAPSAAADLARAAGDRLRGTPASLVIVAEVSGQLRAAAEDAGAPKAAMVTLVLYAGDYPAVRRLPMLAGTWPGTGTGTGTGTGQSMFPPQVALNTAAIDAVTASMGSHLLPGGAVIVRAGEARPQVTATISGTVADSGREPRVYLPWSTAAAFLPGTAQQGHVRALLRASTDPGHVRTVLESAWPGQDVTVDDVARYDNVAALLDQLATMRTLFAWCAAVALGVSALGIVNLGLATVVHRSRELSVRRAVGARRADLFTLVLWSSAATGLLSAALGVALVALTVKTVLPRYIPPGSAILAPGLPWSAVLLGCLAAIGTSLTGALLPALRASRVDIALVLRD